MVRTSLPITADVASNRKSPSCVNRQKKKRLSSCRENQAHAASECMWLAQLNASHTFRSGKQDVVWILPVGAASRWLALLSHQWTGHVPRWLRPEFALDGAGNQRTNRGALCRRPLPECGVKIVWNIDRSSDAHAIIMSLLALRRSAWLGLPPLQQLGSRPRVQLPLLNRLCQLADAEVVPVVALGARHFIQDVAFRQLL